MKKRSSASQETSNGLSKVVGLDVGDRQIVVGWLGWGDEQVEVETVATQRDALIERFGGQERYRVVLEAGTHSAWIVRELEALGHEVIVANPRRLALLTRDLRKSDVRDAEILARLGRADLALLSPVRARSLETQQHLAMVRSRDALVRARTALINCCRGTAKSLGFRLPSADADIFSRKVMGQMPASLDAVLGSLVEQIGQLTEAIRQRDRTIRQLARERYPVTERLQGPRGVGPLTALTFVLIIEDPRRFARARDAGAYVGLVPRRSQSGDQDPSLPITKQGDRLLRRLLVQAAHYILGPFGEDSDLRRFGLRLIERGGARAKRRAVTAVARKLAVLLLALWTSGELYEPLHHEALAASSS